MGWVLIDGGDCGSGFAIGDGRAVTAGHVVRPVTEKSPVGQPDSPAAQAARQATVTLYP